MNQRSMRVRRRVAPALLVALAFVPAAAEAQRAEGAFQRTLTVSGAADIDVVSGSGRIEVRPGPAGRVEVSARIQAHDGWGWRRNALSPGERVRRIEANPPIEQTGNVVRIGHISDEDVRNGVAISYTLTVPSSSTLKAKTGSGSQSIEGIEGRVESSTGSGSLTFRRIGGDLHASTGSGSVTADDIRGALRATSGSGGIRAGSVSSRISAKTGSGEIDVEQAGSGDVDVSSGSGSIRARGVRGALQASTASGSLNVQGELSGDWRLSSSSGSIKIDLPSGQGFEIDASTNSGRINTDFPVAVTGTIDRRSLRGKTQGGGRLLRVRTSSGGISIKGS